MANALPAARSNRELDLHVLQHLRQNGAPAYTIGVWEGQTLRAICHSKGIAGALLALAKEFENSPEDRSPVSCLRWSEIASLVNRLSHRADTDCIAAAQYLEDLHAKLHYTTGELEVALERLEKLGALLEEAAADTKGGEPCYRQPRQSQVSTATIRPTAHAVRQK